MVSRGWSEATLTGPGLSLQAGVMIGARYRVERPLAEGAMGLLVAARNVELDHPVAIKLLLPEYREEVARQTRLVREARAAAKIRSVHVARVFDVVLDGPDSPFIVMELLEGEDVADRLETGGPFSVAEAFEMVAQIGEALGEAHALGIVHRDVKPRNVFAVSQGNGPPLYKLLDLGIAHLSDPKFETLTASQQILGSPAYCAPEQLRAAHAATPGMDIWSVGVLLYECLTGVRPFEGGSLGELCVQILERDPIPPSQHGAKLPQQVDALVLRCLAKRAEDRFTTLSELLQACAPYAPQTCAASLAYLAKLERNPGSVVRLEQNMVVRSGTQSRDLPVSDSQMSTAETLDASSSERSIPRGRSGLVATVALTAVLVSAATYFFAQQRATSPASALPTQDAQGLKHSADVTPSDKPVLQAPASAADRPKEASLAASVTPQHSAESLASTATSSAELASPKPTGLKAANPRAGGVPKHRSDTKSETNSPSPNATSTSSSKVNTPRWVESR